MSNFLLFNSGHPSATILFGKNDIKNRRPSFTTLVCNNMFKRLNKKMICADALPDMDMQKAGEGLC